MYLSQIDLNPQSEQVHKDIADCHEMHKRLMSAFPRKKKTSQGAREQFNILYRLDFNRQSHSLILHVQSSEKPKWDFPSGYLRERGGHENDPIKISEFQLNKEALHKNRLLKFNLRANPTKKIDTKSVGGEKRNGRRVPLIKQEDLVEWINRKANDSGFEIIDVFAYTKSDVIAKQTKGIKTTQSDGQTIVHKLTFQGVNFSGTLKITDPEKFMDAIKKGIGQGKSFGMGLLLLRAIPGQ